MSNANGPHSHERNRRLAAAPLALALTLVFAIGLTATATADPTGATGPSGPSAQTEGPDAEAASSGRYTFKRLSTQRGGAWSFFGDPRSVRRGDHIYTGWIGNRGLVQISDYNVETNRRVVVSLGPSLGRVDDHNNPSIVIRRDGRIMVFYSPHSGRSLPKHGVSQLYYRTSLRPHSVRTWGPVHHMTTNSPGGLGYTYPNPVDIGGGNIWMAWRGGNWQPTAAITYNHGRTWTRARSFMRSSGMKRPYAKYAAGPGNSILMAYNQDNPGTTSTGLYFVKIRPGHGFFDANGRKITGSNGSFHTARGDMVMSKHKNGNLYVMDIAANAKGDPVIVYTAKQIHRPADLYYSEWTGRHWRSERVASVGYALYNPNLKPRNYGFYPTAGASIDHEKTSRIFMSRQIEIGGGRRQLVIERWTRSKHGNWSNRQVSPSNRSCVRPADVRGEKTGAVTMMCGRYKNWIDFNTAIYLARPE